MENMDASSNSGSDYGENEQPNPSQNVKPTKANLNAKLLELCETGNMDELGQVLDQGADVNFVDQDGYSALILSACFGNFKAMQLLLSYGADIDFVSKDGCTALVVAVQGGHAQIVRTLLRHKATINVPNGSSPQFFAAQEGYGEILRLLAKAGADLDVIFMDVTPMFIAAQENHAKTILTLIKLGADCNKRTKKFGATPIIVAVHRGLDEILEILIRQGADVNIQTDDGTTPLIEAVEVGNVNGVVTLLRAGCDLEIKRHNGTTAAQLAVQLSDFDILKALASGGVDFSALKSEMPKRIRDIVLPKTKKKSSPRVEEGSKSSKDKLIADANKLFGKYDASTTGKISLGTLAAIILQLEREHKLALVSDRGKCVNHLDAVFNKLQSDSVRSKDGIPAFVTPDQFKGIYIGIMQQQHPHPSKQKRRSTQISPRDGTPINRRRVGMSPRETSDNSAGSGFQEAASSIVARTPRNGRSARRVRLQHGHSELLLLDMAARLGGVVFGKIVSNKRARKSCERLFEVFRANLMALPQITEDILTNISGYSEGQKLDFNQFLSSAIQIAAQCLKHVAVLGRASPNIDDLRREFNALDTNEDGHIESSAFRSFVRCCVFHQITIASARKLARIRNKLQKEIETSQATPRSEKALESLFNNKERSQSTDARVIGHSSSPADGSSRGSLVSASNTRRRISAAPDATRSLPAI